MDLAGVIAREAPVAAVGPPLDQAWALLDWTSKTVVWGDSEGPCGDGFNALPVDDMYRIYKSRRCGTWCAGMATFYRNVLALFGIDAFVANIGQPGIVSHATVVVPNDDRFFIFDPMFCGSYRAPGRFLDLASILQGQPFTFDKVRPAPVLLTHVGRIAERKERWRIRNVQAVWEDETKPNEWGWVAAHIVAYDKQFRLVAPPENLARLGIGQDEDLILALARLNVLDTGASPYAGSFRKLFS